MTDQTATREILVNDRDGRCIGEKLTNMEPKQRRNDDDSNEFVYRWVCDVEKWEPIDGHLGKEFQFLLKMIECEKEREQVLKYYHFADKKRALVSRLLTRKACAKASNLQFKDVLIGRTKGRKPFFANVRDAISSIDENGDTVNDNDGGNGSSDRERHKNNNESGGIAKAPNFNFNVSHEGKYVALVSEPFAICGVDVAAPDQLRLGNRSISKIEEIFETFESTLHPSEKEQILKQNGLASQLSRFRQIWSLKEAWSKCMGTGLGAKFATAAFTISQQEEDNHNTVVDDNSNNNNNNSNNNSSTFGTWTATISVDGVNEPSGSIDKNWSFHLHPFPPLEDVYDVPDDDTHWITVARGPTSCVVDAHGEFWKTLNAKNIELKRADTWSADIWKPAPRFEMLDIIDLVPKELRYRFLCVVKDELNCERVLNSFSNKNRL